MNSLHRTIRNPPPAALLGAWICIGIVYWLAANPSWYGAGMTWDEAYYYPTFVAVGEWISNPAAALTGPGIVQGWGEINELPPIVKWLGAFSLLFDTGGWNTLWAMRLVPAFAFAGNLVLLVLIARRLVGGLWCYLPAFLMMTHPRLAAHGGIAATETVFITATLFTTWCAMQDLSRWKWRLLLALGCGLALATKVNGIILFCIVLFWLGTASIMSGRVFGSRARKDVRNALLTVPAVLLLAPLVAFAVWPWLWDETGARLQGYYVFIREHVHYGLWYFGERLGFGGAPLVPVTYPLVMSHLATPIPSIALFWIALAAGIIRYTRRIGIPPRNYFIALLLLGPFVAASLPGSPKYDGLRLFLPVFPAAVLLVTIGLHHFAAWLRLKKQLRLPRYAFFVLLILLLPGSRPNIDYYNSIATMIGRDEPVFPFEVTYWGNGLDRTMIDELNAELPPDARIKTLALQPTALEILQSWGLLRSDILINPDPPYDFHLVQNRRGFWGNAEWRIYAGRDPLRTWGSGAAGEPLVFLYDGNPP